MVVSTAEQPPTTYQLWHRFNFPTDHGSVAAVAVPNWVANQLNAAYSTMIALMMVHFWSIVIGITIYAFLVVKDSNKDRKRLKASDLHPLAPTLWNKRSDLLDSALDTFYYTRKHWEHIEFHVLLIVILAAWVGQTAMGILVPPLIIAGYAAPVNPKAIYMPDLTNQATSVTAKRFGLQVPWALRAIGSANVANEDLTKKVRVSHAIPVGQWSNGEDILKIDYGYRVTAQDFGLQQHTDLSLDVTGSCVTEYGWLTRTDTVLSGGSMVSVDTYEVPANENRPTQISVFQGPYPLGFFYSGNTTTGTLDGSNITWAALVSSVNRTSFTAGADPWYLTEPLEGFPAPYNVKPGRPGLSCWEDDVWSYQGRNTTILGLTLPEGLQGILGDYLTEPMIIQVGRRLSGSSLRSAATALGAVFDAGSSSVHDDIERLVLAAYIATTNILIDSTLYPAGADREIPNAAIDDSGQLRDGLSDFVIWTSDVSALSLPVVIAIPSVLVGIWLLAILILYWTPLKIVNALDSDDMFTILKKAHGNAVLTFGKGDDPEDTSNWDLNPEPTAPPEPARDSSQAEKNNAHDKISAV